MKKQFRIILLVLIPLIMAASSGFWARPLLSFLGANSNIIQALADAISILTWIGTALSFLIGYKKVSGFSKESINNKQDEQLTDYSHLASDKPKGEQNLKDKEKILVMHYRVLSELETKAAGYTSLTVPTDLIIQIEDKKFEIAELEKKINSEEIRNGYS